MISITPEYQKVFDLLDDKGNDSPIFVTGGAGTGKSTLISLIRQKYSNTVVVAPTGIAALNVGGATIHSTFKIPPKYITVIDKRKLKPVEVLANTKVLIIDEISMVNANVMDTLEYVLRISNFTKNAIKPFGGVKVIMFGDLYQLPPVVGDDVKVRFEKTYDTPYFFSAKCFNTKTPLLSVQLTKVFRQKDEEFVGLLNNIRMGIDIERTIDKINNRVKINDKYNEDAIYITTTNKKCAEVNEMWLKKIKTDELTYFGVINGKFTNNMLPVDTLIDLKVGAKVMCMRNIEVAVNGTIGIVQRMNSNHVVIKDIDTGYDIIINRTTWENHGYVAKGGNVESTVQGTYNQIPLKLAWAITVHKAQGQTIKEIHVDMSTGAFVSGQLYVALSRCVSLDGITLSRPLYTSDVIVDRNVREFYKSIERVEDNVCTDIG